MFKTLEEWRNFARTGFVLESDDTDLFVYDNNEFQRRMLKPSNWRTIVEVVNGHRAPIRPALRNEIFDLFDKTVPIDARDPWPVLATLKETNRLEMSSHGENVIILKRSDVNKSVAVDGMCGAGAICARWDRLGFEHERLVLFAAIIASPVNFTDPWMQVMREKERRSLKLNYNNQKMEVIAGGLCVRTFDIQGPCKSFAELVRMFNEGEIPPGCVTDWEPFYSVAEALPIIAKAYGTPEFANLRFHTNKLRRY